MPCLSETCQREHKKREDKKKRACWPALRVLTVSERVVKVRAVQPRPTFGFEGVGIFVDGNALAAHV